MGTQKKIKHLLIYFLYVGIVLAVGAKLGVFHKRSYQPSKIGLTARPASPLTSSETLVPLPQGILAFDGELKQATVHEGEAQAHFVFNFTNISSKEVIINTVTTSCGCTTAELPPMPWTLPPRAKGRIPVTMNVLGHTGKSSKTITVTTAQGFKTLTVEANILLPTEGGKMGD